MSKKYGFLFPGQGAQYPGMGKDFYDAFPLFRQIFEEADDYLGRKFSDLIFEGPSEELTLTKNSQIAIYIVGVALYRLLEEQFPSLKPHTCAGLSLGEYTALTAAKKISFKDGLGLVKVRSEAMQKACEKTQGSMQVVLALSEADIQSVIDQFNPPHPIWIANLNCPGQVVIAGSIEALALVAEPLKQKGAKRVLPLDVSGAFHSGLMKPAQEELAAKIAQVPFHDSSIEVVMNVPGDYVRKAAAIRQMLIDQLVCPVRWEKGILNMAAQPLDAYIEMGPGKTLSGMNKRIGIKEPTYSLEKVADLEMLRELLCNC